MEAEKGWGPAFWGTTIAAAIAGISGIVVAYLHTHSPPPAVTPPSKADFDVQGYVLDWETKEFVSGAAFDVSFEGAPIPASTDSKGHYDFKLQATTPTVEVYLKIEARGYKSLSGKFTFRAGPQDNLFLTPASPGPATPAHPADPHPPGTPVLNGPDQFPGTWLNENRSTDGITRVEFSNRLGQINVHMWGKCHPVDCDWGLAPASAVDGSGAALSLQWTNNWHVLAQKIIILPDGRLRVTGHTHFTDNSHRPDYDSNDIFVKQ